jgi:ABC-type glycerol-3-phosphate transport system permease component
MSFRGTTINPDRFDKSQIKFLLILLPIILVMVLPLVYIFNHAFKPYDELFAYPPRFFVRRPTFENFRLLFSMVSSSGVPFSRYLFNSVMIAVVVLVLSILISTGAAYAFEMLDFKGKNLLYRFNMLSMMFVAVAFAIPRYIIITGLGFNDTFFVHVIPFLAAPVGIFLIRQYMKSIPKELIEASKIDGANDYQVFWHVVVPLVKPAMATMGILSFQAVWTYSESSELYIDKESLRTLPYFINTITSATGNVVAAQGISAAASLIMFLPMLAIFIYFQGKVINTMSHSGIK